MCSLFHEREKTKYRQVARVRVVIGTEQTKIGEPRDMSSILSGLVNKYRITRDYDSTSYYFLCDELIPLWLSDSATEAQIAMTIHSFLVMYIVPICMYCLIAN